MSSKFGQLRSRTTELAALECWKIDVATFSRLLFIQSFLYLQETLTCRRARRTSKSGQIWPQAAELAALGIWKNFHRLIMGKIVELWKCFAQSQSHLQHTWEMPGLNYLQLEPQINLPRKWKQHFRPWVTMIWFPRESRAQWRQSSVNLGRTRPG